MWYREQIVNTVIFVLGEWTLSQVWNIIQTRKIVSTADIKAIHVLIFTYFVCTFRNRTCYVSLVTLERFLFFKYFFECLVWQHIYWNWNDTEVSVAAAHGWHRNSWTVLLNDIRYYGSLISCKLNISISWFLRIELLIIYSLITTYFYV